MRVNFFVWNDSKGNLSTKEEHYRIIVENDETIIAKFNNIRNYKIPTIIIPEKSGEVTTEDYSYPAGVNWRKYRLCRKWNEFVG